MTKNNLKIVKNTKNQETESKEKKQPKQKWLMPGQAISLQKVY